LGDKFNLFGRGRQVLEGPDQVVLEAFEAPGDGIGLAGETGGQLLLNLEAPFFQGGDFSQQLGAPLAQFRQGQVGPGVRVGGRGRAPAPAGIGIGIDLSEPLAGAWGGIGG
jgi:hypothetical protein